MIQKDFLVERKASLVAKPSKTWRVGTLRYTTGGLALLFCWLLWGDFAWSMRDRAMPPVVQLLFRRFGASDTLVGILFASLPAGIGLILGPVISYRSDRLRSRWGRRIPFLIFPTPFIVLSMAGIAISPWIGKELHRSLGFPALTADLATLICLSLFWSTFEISCVIANSVFGALINDVVPHSVIGRFFGLFRGFSLAAGILLTYGILGQVENHYVAICLGVGLLYGVGFTLMCLKVKEGEYPPPPAPVLPGNAGGFFRAVRIYFKDSLGRPYYLWFFVTTLLTGMAAGPFNLYALFYAKSIGMDLGLYFKCIAASYVVSLGLSYPLGVLVDRFHPLRVSLIVNALYALVMAWGILCVRDVASFTHVLLAHTILSGIYFTTSASLGQRILPRSKFAEIGSAGGALCNLAGMAMPPLLGYVLDCTRHHYAYVFHASLGFAVMGTIAGFIFYRKFLALGGPDHYLAPE